MDTIKDQSICPCCGKVIGCASAVGVPYSSPKGEIRLDRDLRLDAEYPAYTDAGPAITRNISSTGVYLDINANLEPGQRLSIVVDMQIFGREMLWLCDAEVVRGEVRDGQPGYAATLTVR